MKFQIEIESKFDGSGTTLAVSGIKRVEDGADKLKTKLDDVGKAHHKKGGPFDISEASEEMIGNLLKTISIVGLVEKGFELLGESVNWVKEAIGHADFVRDLNLSLIAYTGSAAAATKVIDYFTESQVKTRNTAEELQQTFRNLNPLANAKGFTLDAQQQITVMLSQISTVSNKSFSEIEAGYRRILSGVTGGASRNALLQVLGISGNQLASMGWDEFLAKMAQVSSRVDEFGQSWESTMHKAEIELKNSFAEGWNEARGSAVEGMDAVTAAVNDPEVKETLKQLGRDTAEWAGQLGGALTELRGIAVEIKSLSGNPFMKALIAMALSTEMGASGVLKLLGNLGNEKLNTDQSEQQRKDAERLLLGAGLVAPQAAFGTPGYSSYTGAYKGMEPQSNITAFKDLANLEKFVADQVTANHLNAEQIAATAAQLKLNAQEAQKAGLSLNVDDVNSAIAEALKGGLEGAPHGKISAVQHVDRTAEIEAQTKLLLQQADILDLQNQKLVEQSQLAQEEHILGEKKTGLENVQLDAATKRLLLQHEIHALHVVDLDQQIEMTKAVSEYWKTIADIDKKQKEEAAKPGGGAVSGATFDAQRQAAGVVYNASLDAINSKMAKGQSDAADAQRKLTLEAQATVQVRNEELIKIRAIVGTQGDENTVLAAQLTNARAQNDLFGLDLALQNQRIGFGATGLSQQTDAMLKLHEEITLRQTENENQIAIQDERSRWAKEQVELAKQMTAVTLTGFTGEGVNPAIDQLTLLAAKQREGGELRMQAIIENGHLKIISNIKSEAELRNAKIEEAMKGYADLANLIGATGHDLVAGLFAGGDMKHMLSNLVTGYQSMLGGALDATLKKYLTSWQQMAQGTIDPATGKAGHVDPHTGLMVPTSQGQQRTAQETMSVMQGAVALYAAYAGAQGLSKQQGAVQGATGGLGTGAAIGTMIEPGIGTIVGAVIGMVVGAIAGYMGGTNKPTYTVTVGGGVISIKGGGDAKQGDVNAAMQSINRVIQDNTTSIHGLFDAFPIAIGQSLSVLKPGDLLKQSGSRWFDTSSFKTFLTQDVPSQMLAAYTPIIQGGLEALGVSQKKIGLLFSQAPQNQQDPAAFFKFITDYVTGFVSMKNTIDFLGKSSADKTAVAMGLANPVVADQLAKANENIAYLGQGFDQLTNTDQVERLKQINAAIANRYQLELQALVDIANARKAVTKSYADTEHGFGMSAADPQAQLILLQSQRAAVAASLNDQFSARTRQLVAGAKTPAEVTAIAESYANLTAQIYNAAKSLRDSFQTVLDSFAALDKQKAADALAALDPTAHLQAIAGRIGGISAQFSGMDQADQIANSQTLIQLATEYYNIQHQALLDLGNAAKSIHDSIAKQIFGIQLDQQKDNPQQQIEMLLAQQRTLYASLGAATTSEQINAIIQQIQGNVTTVAGLEGNTPRAAADSIKALQEADKAAQARIAELTAEAKKNDDAIAAAIKGVTDEVKTTITALDTLMTKATSDLIAFGGLIQTKLSGFVDAMAASDAALLLTLQPIFTALGDAATATGDGLDNANVHLRDFSGALGDATDRLGRFGNWSTSGGGNSFSSAAMSTYAPTFSPQINVNISDNLAPFVGMIRIVANEEMDKRRTQAARFSRATGAM